MLTAAAEDARAIVAGSDVDAVDDADDSSASVEIGNVSLLSIIVSVKLIRGSMDSARRAGKARERMEGGLFGGEEGGVVGGIDDDDDACNDEEEDEKGKNVGGEEEHEEAEERW
jgi:hypothetical protein